MNIQVTHTEPRATPRSVQQITVHTDSREILANAERDGKTYNFADYFIVDVDSHHVELDSWTEVLENIESPVLRHTAQSMMHDWPYPLALSGHRPGLTFQDVGGRIPHQARLAEPVDTSDGRHRDLTLIDRAMQAMNIDVQVVFPQPMLEIGLHPSPEIATQLVFAYNRWFCDRILQHGPKI